MTEERRLVTVLFADVIGSTALGEAMDPEDLRSLLTRYYSIAKDVVAAHGGTLEKFIGDAVVAVFGLPRAYGDDAERALAAALELRARLQADPALADQLPVRIGVNTGEVVASRDPSAGDFLITGDAVNVAARLQQGAEPWSIVCGERTARAAHAAFTFGAAVDVDARGKSAPLRAVPVVGTAARPRARTPLIGRTDDLEQLELAARRAFRDRRPFLVTVMAPPGVGKTRLLEEFVDRLPTVAPGAQVAIAQCVPYGRRLTYWPLRGLLLSLIGLPEDAQPGAILQATGAWLRAREVESPDDVAEALASTFGASDADVDRTTLFGAWRTAVEAAARHSPLLLVFEDLHWSSDSLLELVESVMHSRGDAPVLIVALTRPELLDRRPAWGGGRRDYVSLALEPLADAAIADFVGHLLEVPAPELVDAVVQRAEGNPFYAGEIVRAVVERVPSLMDRAAVDRALATLPDTVQATVLARIDLLPTRERQVLQFGSVFGRAFRLGGIVSQAPELADDAEALVERLVERDLVRRTAVDTYAFRHIVIREVAYGTLPRSDRINLHRAAGRWLEERAVGREDTLAELIAYHYREAASLAGRADGESEAAREIAARAASWLARAADVLAPSASVEAGSHLRSAIELAERDELPDLYERLGDVRLDGATEIEAYGNALELCREMGRRPDDQLRLLGKLLTVYTRTQGTVADRPSLEDMERMRREGEALSARSTDRYAQATFQIAQAFLPFWDDSYTTSRELDRAEASAQRGLETARDLDDADLSSAALDALASVAQSRSDWDAARRYARERLAIQDRLNLLERLDAHSMLTWASTLLGDLDEADRVSAAGVALAQPGQAPGWVLHLLAWRAYALVLVGRWDEATAAAERGRQLWLEMSRSAAGYAVRGFIAALDVARARRDERGAATMVAALTEITRQFDPESPVARVAPYVAGDVDAVRRQLESGFFGDIELDALLQLVKREVGRVEYVERALSLCSDRLVLLSPESTRSMIRIAAAHRHALFEAQAHRALGLALEDADELLVALEMLDRAGALPYAARVRCERASITGDTTELEAGAHVLEQLGDVEHLERVQRRRAAKSRG